MDGTRAETITVTVVLAPKTTRIINDDSDGDNGKEEEEDENRLTVLVLQTSPLVALEANKN